MPAGYLLEHALGEGWDLRKLQPMNFGLQPLDLRLLRCSLCPATLHPTKPTSLLVDKQYTKALKLQQKKPLKWIPKWYFFRGFFKS